MAESVEGVANCDALKIRLFIGTLKASVFDWYVQLPANSIRSWANFEKKFHSPLLRGGSASYHGPSLQHQA